MLFRNVLTLENGKHLFSKIWDIELFYRRTFVVGEDIIIPQDKVLQLHSPKVEGEIFVDGEAYIL